MVVSNKYLIFAASETKILTFFSFYEHENNHELDARRHPDLRCNAVRIVYERG